MVKDDFILLLRKSASELARTIRNWQSRFDLQSSLGALQSNIEQVANSLESTAASYVPVETAQAVWNLADAVDKAAAAVHADVAADVSPISGAIRHFYLSRGAIVDSGGQIAFEQSN